VGRLRSIEEVNPQFVKANSCADGIVASPPKLDSHTTQRKTLRRFVFPFKNRCLVSLFQMAPALTDGGSHAGFSVFPFIKRLATLA
jgi:hypothetical protein